MRANGNDLLLQPRTPLSATRWMSTLRISFLLNTLKRSTTVKIQPTARQKDPQAEGTATDPKGQARSVVETASKKHSCMSALEDSPCSEEAKSLRMRDAPEQQSCLNASLSNCRP